MLQNGRSSSWSSTSRLAVLEFRKIISTGTMYVATVIQSLRSAAISINSDVIWFKDRIQLRLRPVRILWPDSTLMMYFSHVLDRYSGSCWFSSFLVKKKPFSQKLLMRSLPLENIAGLLNVVTARFLLVFRTTFEHSAVLWTLSLSLSLSIISTGSCFQQVD